MNHVQVNTVDGRYVLVEPLGSGGMAQVYLAHDEVLDRDVALKVLRSQYVRDEEFAERFRREARSAASLSHPNIVQVYDRGETEDGTCYIAMEYVSGGTLKKRIEKGTLDPYTAAAVAAQIAEALQAAHERGVIHRDIKPQNVLVTSSGDLKVTDFGIARAASAVTISVTNAIFGTAGYLSPEQALGEPVSPASDLYSLGVILYEMLTGELPYTADNPMAVCMKHVTEPVPQPRNLNPEIPEKMNALVVKLLAKDPADRYGSAAALLADLERMNRPASLITAEATTRLRREERQAAPRRSARPRRRRVSRGMTVAAAVALAVLGTALLGLSQEGAGQGTLPRVQDVAGGLIDPPGDTPSIIAASGASATPHASASPSASASPASTFEEPVVPVTPPPDDNTQTPVQSQYTGGGT
ncbi:MAG TPA: protein kinase [Rubrobacter sp.]|nr:protein kinase [Rubrobacter sp.]